MSAHHGQQPGVCKTLWTSVASERRLLVPGVRLISQACLDFGVSPLSVLLVPATWCDHLMLRQAIPLRSVRASCPSSASNGRPDHSLLNTLHALQALKALLMKHVDIELFHDLNNDIQRLEESIHSDAQHAVRRSLVLGPQHSLLFNVSSILASRVDE